MKKNIKSVSHCGKSGRERERERERERREAAGRREREREGGEEEEDERQEQDDVSPRRFHANVFFVASTTVTQVYH